MFADMVRYKFTFLQHGVIKDDISNWLNSLPLDRLITSTPAEFHSIVDDGTRYKLTTKEVVLTGLPRHDVLLEEAAADGRLLVIMPTWRSSLTGVAEGPGNARTVNRAFFRSEFANRWKHLVHSEQLKKLVDEAGWKVVFVPHPNLEQYLSYFEFPEWVAVHRFGDKSRVHNTFRELSLFLTDYSSKAFDVALLEKPVVYYQFDADVFYGDGQFTARPGYFDYERDGFGQICRTEDKVLATIESIMRTGIDPDFRERASRTFPFRDGRSSERVFEMIRALDAPLDVRGNPKP